MSNIFNISEAASLAMHAMTFMASQKECGPVTSKEMASTMNVSENHLSKVMQRLVKAGLADAHRGPKGGVNLARDSKDITLLEVYEAIEGKLVTLPCLLKTTLCRPGDCIFGDLLYSVNTKIKSYLAATRLSDIEHVFGGISSCAGAEIKVG
jgi:Rrf2 family protein